MNFQVEFARLTFITLLISAKAYEGNGFRMKLGNNGLTRIIFIFKGPSCPSALNNDHKINL